MTSQPPKSDSKLPLMALIALGGIFAVNAVSIDTPLVAIPGIAQGFDVPNGDAQIITSVFFLGFGLAQIPLGLISDRIGRRPVLFTGLAIMLICALLASLAPKFEWLVAARFVQGSATATTALLARAIVRDVSHGREAASMMAFLAGSLAIMIFAMPLLAGAVLWALGWRSVMFMLFIYGAVFAGLAMKYLPETISQATLTQARSHNVVRQIWDGVSSFLRAPSSVAATAYALFSFCGYFMFLVMGASLIVEGYGFDPFVFSLIFALVAFMQWIAAYLNRRYVERIGVEKMMQFSAGFLLIATIMAVGIYFTPNVPLWVFIAGSCVFAFCNGIIFPNVMAIALEPHPTRAGIASSIFGTLTSVGTSLIGMLAGAAYDGRPQTMFLLSAICGGLSLAVFALSRRHLTGHLPSAA